MEVSSSRRESIKCVNIFLYFLTTFFFVVFLLFLRHTQSTSDVSVALVWIINEQNEHH